MIGLAYAAYEWVNDCDILIMAFVLLKNLFKHADSVISRYGSFLWLRLVLSNKYPKRYNYPVLSARHCRIWSQDGE